MRPTGSFAGEGCIYDNELKGCKEIARAIGCDGY